MSESAGYEHRILLEGEGRYAHIRIVARELPEFDTHEITIQYHNDGEWLDVEPDANVEVERWFSYEDSWEAAEE